MLQVLSMSSVNSIFCLLMVKKYFSFLIHPSRLGVWVCSAKSYFLYFYLSVSLKVKSRYTSSVVYFQPAAWKKNKADGLRAVVWALFPARILSINSYKNIFYLQFFFVCVFFLAFCVTAVPDTNQTFPLSTASPLLQNKNKRKRSAAVSLGLFAFYLLI